MVKVSKSKSINNIQNLKISKHFEDLSNTRTFFRSSGRHILQFGSYIRYKGQATSDFWISTMVSSSVIF